MVVSFPAPAVPHPLPLVALHLPLDAAVGMDAKLLQMWFEQVRYVHGHDWGSTAVSCGADLRSWKHFCSPRGLLLAPWILDLHALQLASVGSVLGASLHYLLWSLRPVLLHELLLWFLWMHHRRRSRYACDKLVIWKHHALLTLSSSNPLPLGGWPPCSLDSLDPMFPF